MQAAHDLRSLGLSSRWEALFQPHVGEGVVLARVIRSDRGSALVATPHGVMRAKPATKLLREARGPADLPVVGDWVVLFAPGDLDVPLVEAVLDRSSVMTRGEPGKTSDIQVLAANIDTVFVVHPIAEPPNLRRVERELALGWESGAVPVVVLTKSDLSEDLDAARSAVESVALASDVIAVNALSGEGAGQLSRYLADRRTGVLIGPSGAGKSTLINSLLGEQRQKTREIRVSDGRGRHTTVTRELVELPNGGVLIDTPGLRALGVTGSEAGISAAFADIADLSRSCRFGDCTHRDEPGCAVRAAVESGGLALERLASYHKLIREAEVAAARTDPRLRAEEERKWKTISKAAKDYHKRIDRA